MRRPRRNFLEIAKRIAAMREREKREEEKKLKIYQQVMRVATIILIVINLLLVTDVYLLGSQNVDDSVYRLVTIHHKRSTEYRLDTDGGRYMYINPTGYESKNAPLLIERTLLFHIPKTILLTNEQIFIPRAYNGFAMARYSAPVLLLIGLLAFVFRNTAIRENYFILIGLSLAAVVQCFLLLL